jgi:phage FluMu gp28-like protein
MSEAVLLSNQQDWINDLAAVRVWEKSRRIGASWTDALDSVLKAALKRSEGGMDCFYIGYNKDMAEEYIRDAANWAKTMHGVVLEIFEETITEVIGDNERDILTFKITFSSGHKIVALSSRPTNLRGRQGKVTIDEAAFHNDLPGLLKAAMAFLMWGGQVAVLSTHFGADNPFNELIQDVLAGKKPYSLHQTTFKQALECGLYKRICRCTKKQWSPEAEAKWEAEIRAFYGDDAAEELDCIPSQSKGAWLSRNLIESCMDAGIPVIRWEPPANDFVDWPLDTAYRDTRDWCQAKLDPLLTKLHVNLRHYFGEDFGRTGDLSVVWPLAQQESLARATPFVLEERKAPFRTQEQILYYIVDRLPRFSGGALDARGNGQALAEFARQRYGPDLISEVMLSAAWYREHMPRVKAALEDRETSLPKNDAILDDLRGIKIINGVAKPPENHSKSVDGQRHCDSAVALALAEYARAVTPAPEPWETTSIPRNEVKSLMRGY